MFYWTRFLLEHLLAFRKNVTNSSLSECYFTELKYCFLWTPSFSFASAYLLFSEFSWISQVYTLFPLFNILMPSYTSRSFLSRLEEHLFKGDDILQAYLCMPLLCFWESRQNLPSHRGPLDSLNICVFQWAWPDSWLEEALLAGDTGWKYLVLKFL